MTIIVGPLHIRGDAYAFGTWTPETGLLSGYPYARIEDARAARDLLRNQGRAIACATLEAFEMEIAGSLRDAQAFHPAMSIFELGSSVVNSARA